MMQANKKRGVAFLALPLVVLAVAGWVRPEPARQERSVRSDHETMITAAEIKWGPASAKLPPGAVMAILDGEPQKPGAPFTIRVKVPDGYSVPPHTHPTDEHLTVIQGTILLGMGETFDRAKLREFPAGGYAKLPKGKPHFNFYKGETIIQLHGIGPYDVRYVNPGDDPTRKSADQLAFAKRAVRRIER
jgi:quercetin dioxygenase-like cupin family protein